MAAVVQIHEMSAGTTGSDKTSGTIRFKDADNSTVDTNNPLVIPGAGSVYSYTKTLRAKITTAPAVQVSNLRWYSAGGTGFGTALVVKIKSIGSASSFVAHYKTAMSGGTNLFSYTSGSPFNGDGNSAGPWTASNSNCYVGDLIDLQCSLGVTGTQGQKAAETLTLAYDEI